MNVYKIFALFFIASNLIAGTAHAGPLDKLKKKYRISAEQNGYHKITDKKKPKKVGFVTSSGKIALKPRERIYSHAYPCGKVLTGEPWWGPNENQRPSRLI